MIVLCICIGTGVPWLVAIYSDTGARQLIENSVFGLIGVTLGALAFGWISHTYSLLALISAGPVRASDYCRWSGSQAYPHIKTVAAAGLDTVLAINGSRCQSRGLLGYMSITERGVD